MKKKPSGRPRLWSPSLLTYYLQLHILTKFWSTHSKTSWKLYIPAGEEKLLIVKFKRRFSSSSICPHASKGEELVNNLRAIFDETLQINAEGFKAVLKNHHDGDVPFMLELWGMQSRPLLPSLPDPLWPFVVAPDRVLSMSKTESNCVIMLSVLLERKLFWHVNSVLMINWIVRNRTVLTF